MYHTYFKTNCIGVICIIKTISIRKNNKIISSSKKKLHFIKKDDAVNSVTCYLLYYVDSVIFISKPGKGSYLPNYFRIDKTTIHNQKFS